MSGKDRRSETSSRERLPVTDPERNTVSEPETPTVTDPQTPPVMDPETPNVTDLQTPTATDREIRTVTDPETPTVTDPETPTVTDPETPTVADPDLHPETRTDKHADKYSEELTKALPEQLNDEQPEQETDKYPEQLTEKYPVELNTENLEQLIEKHPEEPTSQKPEEENEDNQDIDSPMPSETFILSKRFTTGDMRREVTSRIITYKNLGVDQFAFYKDELEHQLVYTRTRLVRWVQWLPDMRLWNIFMCMTVLGAIVMAITYDDIGAELASVMDTAYNMLYLVYVAGFALNIHTRDSHITTGELFRFVADAISYVRVITNDRLAMIACYTIRTIRPLEYLCTVKDFNLKGSVLGTTFKWTYLFLMVRVIMTIVKMAMNKIMVPVLYERHIDVADYSKELLNATFIEFLLAFHNIDKMFIPVGTHMEMSTNADQIFCMLVVMLGCFMMTGAAVASLSLVFSLYMMPEEVFRGRYRLIMKELEVSHVQTSMRQTVETFYKMYWKKQRAVSTAALLKILPPSLYNEIITDIYFQAIQKSFILRNLPSHFMPEIAKEMTTLHYIPGDTIIHRAKPKQAMYYITYGDIEMVTAEDDSTSILRFTRGTILTPSSGCIVVGCGASHVTIRAATFCMAYKLRTVDLWKKAIQQSRERDFSSDILLAFFEQLERIKLHYIEKPHPKVNYLSSIYHFRLGLNKLKNYRDKKGKKLLGENIFLEIAGTYIMRNNLLSEDPICIRQTFPCILQPTSSLLDAWSIFVTLCTLIITFTHPYTLAFKEEIPLRFIYFDQLIMGIFLLDLIVNLSTGEHIEEGQVVSIGQTAAHQACSRRFFTDVMAILPVFNFIGDGRFGGMNKLIKLPKLFHFLAMLENQCVYYSHIIRFLSYTFLVGTVSYLIAAFNQAMMCYSFDMCDITNLTTLQHWGTVTDDDNGHDTVSVKEQRRVYFGLYWSISLVSLTRRGSQFVSYEQSFPPEFLNGSYYTLFLLELVTLLYIFIEAVYSATIMVTSAMHDDFDAVIRIVKDFMERNRINAEVTKRFITYLQLCWYTDQAYAITHKKQSIFHDLPPHVYQDIVAKQHMAYIKVIPFMKLLSKRELTQIASKLKLFYTSPNEILLNTGDVTSEMYVIKQGTCEVLCPTTKTVIRYLKAKDHFGVPDCILGIPVYYTIRAATHVQVFSLGKRYFTKIVQHSGVINAIESIKKTKEFNVVHDSEYMPFVSYEPMKQPPNRSIFKLPRKYEKDVDFQSPFQQLGFLSILRYIFPRFTIRPDGKYLQRYEWFRAFCALCSAMVFPNCTYLSIQFPFLNYFRFFLDLSAYFDIVQRLLVGYYNEKGVLVYHPASTAANYIRTAFVMDFLGCIPLENLEPLRLQSATDDFQHRGYRITRNHQYLMFNRLLQLYRFIMTIDTLSTYMRKDFVLVLKYLPLFMTLCNVLSSLLVLYTVAIYYIPDSEGMRTRWQISERWISPTLSRYYHTPWAVFNAEQYRFNITESPWNIHLATYFWVVYETTTTGYNSIFATNAEHLEILFFGMLINKMLYTYFSVRVISTRANVNKALCTFQEHMRDLNAFMVREHLDESLQWNIQSYYEYNWDMVGGIDSRSVLKMCDQVSLRTDTILQMYGSTFSECPILPTGDSSLLRILSRGIQDVHFRQNTEIIRENDVASKMYFIANGTVKIRGKVGETRMSATLTKGSVFGNLDAGRIRLPLKATAQTNVHMLEIGSSVFHHIIADFPTVDELMKRLRPNNECFIKASFHERARARRQKRKTIYTIEVVENFEKKVWTRHPCVLVFMIVITLITIYTDMYHVAFGNIKSSTIIVLYITDVLFFLKIPMMVTIPPNEELKIKQKLRELRKQYFKFEFIVDLISVLPLEALCFLYPANKWQFFAWLRLNRLFRIPTVYLNLYHYKQKMSINLTAATLGSVAIWFTLSMHAISCIWWMIGTVEETKMPKSSWRYNLNGSLMCENDYVCSFFFMLTTFTHNGDGGILPRKQSEIIYIVLIQIISTMVFMIYVGEFSNIIQFNNFRVFRYYSDYLDLKAYLKNNNVSLNLLKLVKRYSMHLWRENRGIQIPEFLTTAPDTIRLRIMQAAYQKHLDAHPVFTLCEQAFLRQLVGCLKLYAYENDMYIVREQEVTDSMYFIHKGSVVETKENQKSVVENKNKRFYHAGEYFGSLQGLLRRKPYPFTYKTVTIAQILILRMDDWEEIVKFYPRSKRAMYGFSGDFGDQGEARLTFLDAGSRKSSLFPMDSRYSTTTMDSSYNLHPLESRKSIANTKLSDHTKKVLQDEYTHSQGDKQLKPMSKLDKYYMEHEFQHSHHSHSRKNSSSSHLSRDSVVSVPSNPSIRALKFAGHPHGKSTAFQIPQRSPKSSTTSSMEPTPVKFYLRPSTTSDRSQATSKGASFMMHPSPDEQETRGLPFRTPSSNLHMSSDSDTMITAPILPLRSAPTDEPTFNVQRDLSYVKSWVNQLTKTAELAAEARLQASVQTDSLNRKPEVTPAKSQKENVSQGAAKAVQLKLRESVPNVSTDREPEPTPTKSRKDTGTQGAIIPNKDKPPRRNRYIIDMKHVDDDEDDESVAKTKPDNK